MNIYKKIEAIEEEILNLKSVIIKISQLPKKRKVISLKGLLKGIKVDEKDIEEAEKSLFKIDLFI